MEVLTYVNGGGITIRHVMYILYVHTLHIYDFNVCFFAIFFHFPPSPTSPPKNVLFCLEVGCVRCDTFATS